MSAGFCSLLSLPGNWRMNSALHRRSQALTRSRRSSGQSTRAVIQEEAARPKGAGIFLRAFSFGAGTSVLFQGDGINDIQKRPGESKLVRIKARSPRRSQAGFNSGLPFAELGEVLPVTRFRKLC